MSQRILLVEDEASIADTVVYALENSGFKVRWTQSFQEAMDHFLEKKQDISKSQNDPKPNGPFDLCILDVGLPDQSGFDLCKEIRKTSAVPIVFLTARSEEVDRIIGFELGGDDYICKPYSPRELVARVRAILKRAQQSPNTDQQPTGFVVDDQKKRIVYKQTTLELTRYEYGILKTLVERPGRVYTRETLMTMIWDEPESAFDRTVDAHIKAIRAKLRAADPQDDSIVTHRGIGYSLKD